MITTAMEVVAALMEAKMPKQNTIDAPTPRAEASEEDRGQGDDDCLIFETFGPLEIAQDAQDEGDECLIFEAFGPLATAGDDDDCTAIYVADKLIVEAFDTFTDAPAAGPSLCSHLMEAAANALAAVKQFAIDCAIAVVVATAKWAAWYAVIWAKEYAKLTLELEMELPTAAKRMKMKTRHTAQWW